MKTENKSRLPSIQEFVQNIAQIKLRKYAKLSFLILSIIYLFIVAIFEKNGIDSSAEAIVPAIADSMLVGDRFQISRQLSSFTSGGSFFRSWVIAERGGVIASAPVAETTSVQLNSIQGSWDLTANGNGVLLTLTYPIYSRYSGRLGRLIVVDKIRIWPFAIIVITFLILYSFLSRFVLRLSRQISKDLSSPITDFCNKISDLESIGDYSNISDKRVYRELFELETSFSDLMRRLRLAECRAKELLKHEAIARTTQALAHDVRKPFSLFKMAVDLIQSTEDSSRIKSIVLKVIPEVDKAMASVNGLISDVMEFGSTNAPNKSHFEITSLLKTTLTEVFSLSGNSSIDLEFNLNHNRLAYADPVKFGRVFTNIIFNAVQAVGRSGKLVISSSNIRKNNLNFILISIANLGSFIPEADKNRIFDAFFTKNKNKGTGLGLAIVHKIIESHGCEIWCNSEINERFPKGIVEFCFTIESSNIEDQINDILPHHSSEFRNILAKMQDRSLHRVSKIEDNLILELVEEFKKSKENPLRAIVVDDDDIYHNILADYASFDHRISSIITLKSIVDCSNYVQKLNESFDLFIIDIDLNDPHFNGFDIARLVREKNPNAYICINSDRNFVSDGSSAFNSGADVFIPKPITLSHFLKIAICSIKKKHNFT